MENKSPDKADIATRSETYDNIPGVTFNYDESKKK